MCNILLTIKANDWFLLVKFVVLTNLFLLPARGMNLCVLSLALAKALHTCLQPGREKHRDTLRITEKEFFPSQVCHGPYRDTYY